MTTHVLRNSEIGYQISPNGTQQFIAQGNAADILAFFLGATSLVLAIHAIQKNS